MSVATCAVKKHMSNLQLIERLCKLLDQAQDIIQQQAELLEMHGIATESGVLEESRAGLLADVESSI